MPTTPLDADQQSAVYTRHNTVVVAGAGSGKTTVLARRFVHLVAEEHVPVDRILTLTFTRKAAAEMHERIYRLLREQLDDPFVAEQAARFDQAQISTLDSFCGRIVRAAAGEFGVPPDYRTDEDELADLARSLSLDFLVRRRDTPALARLIAANGFDAVLTGGFMRLATDYLTVVPEQDFPAMFSHQIDALTGALEASLRDLQADTEALLSIETQPSAALDRSRESLRGLDWEALLAAARTAPGDGTRTDQAGGRESPLEEIRTRLQPILQINLRGGAKGDPGAAHFKEQAKALREEGRLIVSILETLQLREELSQLFELVAAFRDELNREKRRRGLLSYRDVLSLAVHALEERPATRSFFASRFDRIMIDEFQDNNEEQKRLLYLLSLSPEVLEEYAESVIREPGAELLRPDRLFFVGDEKQSIYRFRGADVRAFKGLAGELAAQGNEAVFLRTNYRSAEGLIHFFNRLFARIMGDGEGADHEARFEALSAGPAGERPSSVELLYAPRDQAAAAEGELLRPDEAEAYAIGRRILRAIGGEERALSDGEGHRRPPAFHEIAVLLRSSGNQIIFERVFRALGIPYQTQSVRSLFLEAPAYDVYAWLRLLTLPEDLAAYAAVLRSPTVGVSDDALGLLLADAAGPGDPEGGAPFAPSGETTAALGGEDRRRLEKGRELHDRLCALADVAAHSELISELWHACGYRYLLLRDPRYHSYLEHYDYLLELARRHGEEPLAAFAEALRGQLGQYQRPEDVEVHAAEQRGVQIMTIHKSKGLEFPIVFLANAGNLGRGEGMGTSPVYLSERFGLTFNLPTRDWALNNRSRTNYFFQVGKAEDEERERAELKRLLYVAATRAENHLVVSGVFNRQNVKSRDHLLNMVLRALGFDPELLAQEAAEEERAGEGREAPLSLSTIPPVGRRELYSGGRRSEARDLPRLGRHLEERMTPPRRLLRRDFAVTELAAVWESRLRTEEVAPPGLQGEALEPAGETAGETAAEAAPLFGSTVHELIAGAVQGRLRAGAFSPEQLSPPLRRRLGDAAGSQLFARAAEMAERFLESETGEYLRGATARGHLLRVEEPFVLHYPAGEFWFHGQFDFLLVEGERSLVIDLKTDTRELPERHALQLFLYRQAATALTGGASASTIFYLRSGRSVEVTEEISAATIRSLVEEISGG